MSDINLYGKKHEKKVAEWLDHAEDGFSLDRIPDQMTGFYGSSNICDYTLFRSPDMYYIECKATQEDRFDFNMLSETQHDGLYKKSSITRVHGLVIVLFVTYKRAFVIDIRDIVALEEKGKKSLNIKKIDKWEIPYTEIQTIPSRKQLLDYDYEQAKKIFQSEGKVSITCMNKQTY